MILGLKNRFKKKKKMLSKNPKKCFSKDAQMKNKLKRTF